MLKTLPRFDEPCDAAERFPGIDLAPGQLFLNILATGEAASRFEGNFLAHHDLSHGRLILLWLLDEDPAESLRSSELADLAGVSRATITGLLDSLERDRLIERCDDPADRRAVSVRITAEGKKRLDSIMPSYFQRVGHALKALSETEKQQLVSLLNKVQEAFLTTQSAS